MEDNIDINDDEIEYLSEEELQAALSMTSFSLKYYLYFDENGNITAITNEMKSDNSNYVVYDYNDVKDFLTNKKNVLDYTLRLTENFQHVIVEKADNFYTPYGFDVITQHVKTPAVIITWNKADKTWSVRMNNQVPNNYTLLYGVMHFFVSFEKNIDFLIRSFQVNLKELRDYKAVTIPFVAEFEEDINSVVLSTTKLEMTYGLEINE